MFFFFIAVVAVIAHAKTLGTKATSASSALFAARTLTQITQALPAFEAALTPYLQQRSGVAAANLSGRVKAPSEADVFAVARYWNMLSPEFTALYAKALAIPTGLKTYNSPGGHYQILYSVSGPDAVDLTDTIGYSTANWRVRQHGPNGIPDYVEYVAYAADSAWSMEVSRFGFPAPFPYVDNGYSSPLSKIYVHQLRDQYGDVLYGQTWPVPDESVPGGIGFRSYFEIQNNWDLFAGSMFDYAVHPEKAIQVTCVHENFHTIQFAMTKQLTADQFPLDFPVSWLEGTAVLMEDLGFNYVHDYIQYIGDYFDNPHATVFEPQFDDAVYKNSIVTIYLSQFTADTTCICFIKSMFFNDYHSPTKFAADVETSALQNGRTWADLLGSFHTGSYFVGPRAVTGRFIADASLITGGWTYATDTTNSSGAVRKSVNPFAMNTYSYVRQAGDGPTLGLSFAGDTTSPGDTDTSAVWSVRCILKRDTVAAHDSLFALPFSSKGAAAAGIAGWRNYSEALVVATNARYDQARFGAVTFQVCDVMVHKGDSALFSSAPAGAPESEPRATVSVHATSDLLCSLSVETAQPSTAQRKSALADSMFQVESLYQIQFPSSWQYGGILQLTITEPRSSVHSTAQQHNLPDASTAIFRFDSAAGVWSKCPGALAGVESETDNWQYRLSLSGTYGVFVQSFTFDTTKPPVAFPNPIRLSRDSRMAFRGAGILELWIYATDGSLVTHAVRGQNSQPRALTENAFGFDWLLRNASGRAAAPGIYFAHIGFKDPVTQATKKQLQKIFIIP